MILYYAFFYSSCKLEIPKLYKLLNHLYLYSKGNVPDGFEFQPNAIKQKL